MPIVDAGLGPPLLQDSHKHALTIEGVNQARTLSFFRGHMPTAVESRTNSPRIGFVRTAKAYIALTKPRVIELLLITTVPVMILAQGGIPNLWLVLATLVGGSLSAGSANAFNC